ncbi:PREDICTED: bolA-like protein DDB_G0274169 [Rhagoletis zephyria]|uniref:bolA-like protein DDB_G0274169 n=1 Tax=Rhagoletis zephyria TaxID=28612 RepID=UPI0008118322|nr:PREDICTED: bolA-like protein DDB_G0274169 [Rhagoletis zephyria]
MNLFRSATLTLRSAQLHRMLAAPQTAPIEAAIRAALTVSLQPVHLEVINESYMHNVPKGSETHFKVLIVSEKFDDLSLIKRHRLINSIVKEKLAGDFVHALSIEAKTPKQWDGNYTVEPSPNCRGGFGK